MTPPKHQFNIKWSDISKKGELYIEFRPVPFRYLVGGVMTPPYEGVWISERQTEI